MSKEVEFDLRKIISKHRTRPIKGPTRVDIDSHAAQNLSSDSSVTFSDRRKNIASQLAFMTFQRHERSIILDELKGIAAPQFILGNLNPPKGWRIIWSNMDAGIWIARQR